MSEREGGGTGRAPGKGKCRLRLRLPFLTRVHPSLSVRLWGFSSLTLQGAVSCLPLAQTGLWLVPATAPMRWVTQPQSPRLLKTYGISPPGH